MNVLCVVAHPDDEVLACGGTLAKHAENGDNVRVFVLAVRGIRDALLSSSQCLGVEVGWNGLPDQAFDTLPFSEIEKTVPRGWRKTVGGQVLGVPCEPDVIYTHHPDDLNGDHALTAKAVLTAFRPKPGMKARTILACEVLSSTEYTTPVAFTPNYYVTLTPQQLDRKVEALRCYQSELCEWPHPRSPLGIRNLAAYRGQSIGVERAEAFELLRAVWDD